MVRISPSIFTHRGTRSTVSSGPASNCLPEYKRERFTGTKATLKMRPLLQGLLLPLDRTNVITWPRRRS